jgi:hypothetical protein
MAMVAAAEGGRSEPKKMTAKTHGPLRTLHYSTFSTVVSLSCVK